MGIDGHARVKTSLACSLPGLHNCAGCVVAAARIQEDDTMTAASGAAMAHSKPSPGGAQMAAGCHVQESFGDALQTRNGTKSLKSELGLRSPSDHGLAGANPRPPRCSGRTLGVSTSPSRSTSSPRLDNKQRTLSCMRTSLACSSLRHIRLLMSPGVCVFRSGQHTTGMLSYLDELAIQ